MIDDFSYLAPQSLEEALQTLGDKPEQTKILAGGTDLLVLMKEGKLRPSLVVDIGGIDELRGVRLEDGRVWIGPLTTHQDLAHSALIQKHGRALAQGASQIGSPQIRHQGTIGGNIANASPAADTVPPLVVLGAEVQISALDGSRWIPIESLMLGPSQTTLRPHELITAVRFPVPEDGFRSRYEKFGSRKALSIAVVSVAVAAVSAEVGRLAEVRVALGSASPTVVRAFQAEKLLMGEVLSQDLIVRAAASVGEECCPIDDVRGSIWYRRHLTGALLTRILSSWMEDS